MKALETFRQLIRRCDGSIGAEFALLVPVLMLFLLGIIDVGRYMWSINELEKATQMGARMAVVTDVVPGGLAAYKYGDDLGQGAPIPPSAFGAAECTKPAASVSCNCKTDPCPTLTPINTQSFQNVADRMKLIAPMIADSNIFIEYTNSGLGYAGDPDPFAPDVAPIVTVRAQDVAFVPLIFQFFGSSLKLPTEKASLVLEDAHETHSN